MSDNKMHANEYDIDENLVRKILSAQFPQREKLPISQVKSDGAVHIIYRFGTDMCVHGKGTSH